MMEKGEEMIKDLKMTKKTLNSNLEQKKMKFFKKGAFVNNDEFEGIIKPEITENEQLIEEQKEASSSSESQDEDEGMGMASVWKANVVTRAQKLFGEKLNLNKYVYDEITKEQDINGNMHN